VTYKFSRRVSLLSKYGPIPDHVAKLGKGKKTDVVAWHLSEEQILKFFDDTDGNRALIADIKPSQEKKGIVSMLRVEGIWGYSCSGWTPMLFALRELFSDRKVKDAEKFKKVFNNEGFANCLVHEFLYMLGDHTKNDWKPGMAGYVNATLLWEESLKYFYDKIKENFKNEGRIFNKIRY